MKTLPTKAQVVILGSGITGCSMAYFLSELGWTDILVIDQGNLPKPGGSSSHAPGGMFQTNGSKLMVESAHYGVHFYKSLNYEGVSGAELTGGIELAETEERVRELHRRCGLGRSFGLEGNVISAAECGKMLPHLDTSKIKAGYYVPDDGVGRALVCTQALRQMAEQKGVKFVGRVMVQDIQTEENKLGYSTIKKIITDCGDIETNTIVCCAGFWGPKIGKMVGQPIPLMPMAHLYAISEPLPELEHYTDEVVLPMTRAQDNDLYFRQHHNCWSVGYYGHKAHPLWAEQVLSPDEAPEMPSLIEWDARAFDSGWQAAANLFPSLGKEQKLSYKINGIFSFTPDGGPLMGESLKVKGFWSAEAFWYTHAAGLAKMVAEWMHYGEPQIDCHEGDINRFYSHVHSRSFTKSRGVRQYVEVYDILHPKEPSLSARNIRQSPLHHRHLELGGYMLEAAGYERPQWYESNQKLLEALPVIPAKRDEWSAKHYSEIEAAEAWITRNKVGLYDLSAFAIFSLEGANALERLQALCSNNIDIPIGRMSYTNLLDDRGGIVCDLTVMRHTKDSFWIPTGGGAGPHDFAWLAQNLNIPEEQGLHLNDISSQYNIFGLWGPNARELLNPLCDEDLSNENLRFFAFKNTFIDEIPVTIARLSYVGELGFEIYTQSDYTLALWDKLTTIGAIPCGQGAFDSLRIEKGMRGWGADLDPDHTPLEAGLDFIVNFNHSFKGKRALIKQKEEGIKQKLCTLSVEDGQVLLGKEPIYLQAEGGDCIAYVTSANFGHTVQKSLLYAYLPITYSQQGYKLWVEYLGKRYQVMVEPTICYDEKSEKIRA
jgi:glycine cleavage system T protein